MTDASHSPLSRRQAWLIPLLLIGIVAGFLHPYLFQGRSMLPLELVPRVQPWARHAAEHPPTPPVENPLLDSLQQYYPRRVHFQRSLQQGRLPLWDSNVYGGVPFDAIQQGAVFYPPAWALSVLPAELQFGWSAFFHLSLAAIGGWLFFLQLGLRPAGALTGALAFALNGFIVVWLAYPNVTQWTLCWLPLIFYFWERGRQSDDLRWMSATSVALAMAILGGHGQTATYVLLAWGIYALVGALSTRSKLTALGRWVVLPAIPALLLGAAQLLPALEYLPQTDRGAKVTWEAVVRAGMPPAQLWTWLLPHLFGDETARFGTFPNWMPLSGKHGLAYIERSFYPGITILALAATAWVTRKSQRHVFWYALGLVIATVLLAMGTWLYWPLWKIVPGFGNFTAVARILCLAGWGLACLAALGAHGLSSSQPEERRTAIRTLLGAVILLAALAGAGHFIYGGAGPEDLNRFLGSQGKPTLDALAMRDLTTALGLLGVVAALAALAWPRNGGRSVLPVGAAACLIALVAAADLIGFGFGYNPKSDPSLLLRDTPELRALREKPGPFRVLGDSPSGQPLDLRQRMPANLPAAFDLADIGGSDSFQPKRYLAWLKATRKAAQDAGATATSAPANLSAASVRYYLTGSDTLFPGLKPAAGTGLQEDPRALPYARLHTSVRRVKDRAEMLGRLADPYRLELVALTEQPDGPTYHGRTSVTAFKTERISANHLRLTGEAPALGLLVVSEAFNAGWKALVDGRPARVVPVDLLLSGVPIEEPGRHTIDLVYAPTSLRAGLFLSLCALFTIATLVAAGPRRQARVRK